MLTGEFTGLGVTRLLDAVRQVCPKARFYQASSSEMFGRVRRSRTELTPLPRSPYGVAKAYGHYITVNYRKLQPVCGLGHSVSTMKAAARPGVRNPQNQPWRARIKLGLAEKLALGNLDAQRD